MAHQHKIGYSVSQNKN